MGDGRALDLLERQCDLPVQVLKYYKRKLWLIPLIERINTKCVMLFRKGELWKDFLCLR